jgi:hypothetical protein
MASLRTCSRFKVVIGTNTGSSVKATLFGRLHALARNDGRDRIAIGAPVRLGGTQRVTAAPACPPHFLCVE